MCRTSWCCRRLGASQYRYRAYARLGRTSQTDMPRGRRSEPARGRLQWICRKVKSWAICRSTAERQRASAETAGPAYWRSASSKINGAFDLTNSAEKSRSSVGNPSTLNHLTAGRKHSTWSKPRSTLEIYRLIILKGNGMHG